MEKTKFERFKRFLARQKHRFFKTEAIVENCICRLTDERGEVISDDEYQVTLVIADTYFVSIRIENELFFIVNKDGDGCFAALFDPSGVHEIGSFLITRDDVKPGATVSIRPPDKVGHKVKEALPMDKYLN